MRVLVCRAVIAVLLAAAGAVPQAAAADLDYTGQPSLAFGCAEPWIVKAERPPRKGFWYYTETAPTVNFLVPCNAASAARPAPGTPAWYDYCQRRWPSFDPRTGTVLTPDGPRRCI